MKTHRKITVGTKNLRNQKEASIYVIRLAAGALNGALGDDWCNGFDDEESNRRAVKARNRFVVELDVRANRLEKNLRRSAKGEANG